MLKQNWVPRLEVPRVDVVIIGAGVVGCAVAAVLSEKRPQDQIVVLESGPRIAEGITSRNSGVIHAGIYYPPQSLKAQLCVEGNERLRSWVEKKSVPHRMCGKLIVATNTNQEAELEKLYRNALASGAKGLQRLSGEQVRNYEPSVQCERAILSSYTGIVDPYELSRSLILEAEEAGAVLMTANPATAITRLPGRGYRIETPRDTFDADVVVNSAGLHADEIARLVGINTYTIYPCRGNYFQVAPVARFKHLIYPVKDPASPGLGIHLTLDLSGQCKLGPDVEYVSSKTDFFLEESLTLSKEQSFRKAADSLLGPGLYSGLKYDTCGIRPKLRSPEETSEKDFVIQEDLPGFINLIGIESPGLTSSLAIAHRVAGLLH